MSAAWCPKDGRRPGEKAIALITAKEIFDLVREDLGSGRRGTCATERWRVQPVSEITSYFLGGGGKRMRPALLLLCNGYTGRKARAKERYQAGGGCRAAAQRDADS